MASPKDTNSDFTKDLQELAYELEKGNEPTVYWKDFKEMRGYHTPIEVNPSKKEPKLVHLQKVYDFIEVMEVIESQLALTKKFSSQNVSRENFTERWKDNERILKERYPHVNDPAKFEEMQQLYVQWNFMLLLKGGPDEYLEKKCRLRHELKLASNDMVQLGHIATCSYSEEERVQMLMEQWESSTKARRLRLLSGLGFPAGFKIPDKINVPESHY